MLRENLGSANSDPDVVDQLMRDLSNFDAMSQPGNSYKLKMKNRCISQKALDLMSRCSSFDQWHEQTTNETLYAHQCAAETDCRASAFDHR